jgi:segregation and condensation protein A
VDRVTRAHPLTTFSELLDGDERAETLVATFLAILELCKRGMVTLSQARVFGEIEVARVEGAPPFELDNSDLTSIEEDS